MARRPSERNVWIGNYLRANRSTDMAAANAAYKRARGGASGAGIGRVRRNPSGGLSLTTLAVVAAVAYAASPAVQATVNAAAATAAAALGYPGQARPTTARAV